MKKDELLGSYGSISLVITLTITKVLISAPSFYVRQSLSAGWLEVLIRGLFELFVFCLILKFVLAFDKKDIIDISEISFGAVGKYLVGGVSCIIFIICTAAVFRSFAEMVRNAIIRGVSYEFVAIFIVACSMVGAFLGIKTQTDFNGIILPLLLIAVGGVLFINYSRMSVSNIQPVFGPGLGQVVKNALLKNSSFFETGVILYLVPMLGNRKDLKRISLLSVSLTVILTTLVTLFYQLAVPYEAAASFALPLYQLTRMLKAGTFFQRIEPLNIFIWGAAVFVYTGVGIWLSAYVLKKTFNLKSYKPVIFIITEITCLLALIPGSETSVERIYDFILTYSYIAFPLLMMCVLVASRLFIRKKS